MWFGWVFGYLVSDYVVVCFVWCWNLYQFYVVCVLFVDGLDLCVWVQFVVVVDFLVVGECVVMLYEVEVVGVGCFE